MIEQFPFRTALVCAVFIMFAVMDAPGQRSTKTAHADSAPFYAAASMAAFALILTIVVYVKKIRLHFAKGDCCPAIVVSTNPVLLAVYTDLRKGSKPYPVLKVMPARLGKGQEPKPALGMKVVVVASYIGKRDESPAWRDIRAYVAQSATGEPSELDRLIQSLGGRWLALAKYLPHLPKPIKPGIYSMRAVGAV
jgi:hypothetical protein